MRVLARDGIARVQSLVAPLLVVSLVLVLAVHIPHVGVSSTAPAAGSAAGRCSSSPPSC